MIAHLGRQPRPPTGLGVVVVHGRTGARSGTRRSTRTRPRPAAPPDTPAQLRVLSAKCTMSVTASPARVDRRLRRHEQASGRPGTGAAPTCGTRTPDPAAEATASHHHVLDGARSMYGRLTAGQGHVDSDL